jgi:L-alanine-DL-glutamate epimerase-like enolase superfamily enzyme
MPARLRDLALDPFALELASPLSTARGPIDRREGVLVRATVDGARGVGEATPLPGWTELLDDCLDALRSIRERDVADAAAALADLPAGEYPAARHGLQLAIADARTRAAGAGVPLAAHLASRGGIDHPSADAPHADEDRADPSLPDVDAADVHARTGSTDAVPDRVPVNATVGDEDRDATVAAVQDAVGAGYRAVKLKVGARGLDPDVERLRAARRAVGPDVELRADANGAWDRETAAAAVDALAGVVDYVEQPLTADDLAGHAALRGRGVPIALDESLAGRSPAAVLAADAADVLILKPMALGGVDRARAAASRAIEAGVAPVVTTTIDGAVARAGAVHLAASIPGVRPCGLATAGFLATDLLADPAPVADGRAVLPAGPGLGDAFDGLRASGLDDETDDGDE